MMDDKDARIAALEAELAERTRERDEARMHFAMVAMHFPEGDLTIGAVKQLAAEWLREHDAAERERREAAEALVRDAYFAIFEDADVNDVRAQIDDHFARYKD